MSILKMLCDSLCMDELELLKFSSTAPYRYKVYQIPKRNSQEMRTIAHPSKELKFIQRLLVAHLAEKLRAHHHSYAYSLGRGIKENALEHAKSSYLLKMDFQNFFPSITPELLFTVMNNRGIKLDEIDGKILSRLLFWRPVRKGGLVLSIGAPSSPMVSNFVMYDFDFAISNQCGSIGINYTRYADDLTFSTSEKNVLFRIPLQVEKLLKETTGNFIKIKKEKTIYSSKAHNRHVTGVTITNENKISIGRKNKRKISSLIHKFTYNELTIDEVKSLNGLISHATHIEGDFYYKMIKKYGYETLEKIKKSSLL